MVETLRTKLLSNRELFQIDDIEEVADHLKDKTDAEQMRYILENLTVGPARSEFVDSAPFTGTIDVEQFQLSERDKKDFSFALETIKSYLAMPIIFDGFDADHEARRTWRNQMYTLFDTAENPVFKKLQGENKLRGNTINLLSVSSYLLKQIASDPAYEGRMSSLISPLNALEQIVYQELPNGDVFNGMKKEAIKEKIAKVDTVIIDFLNACSDLSDALKAEKKSA